MRGKVAKQGTEVPRGRCAYTRPAIPAVMPFTKIGASRAEASGAPAHIRPGDCS
jgi:hypothetical protein